MSKLILDGNSQPPALRATPFKEGGNEEEKLSQSPASADGNLSQPPALRATPFKEGGNEGGKEKAPFSEGGGTECRGLRPYANDLKPAAQELRKNATRQENHLWYDFLCGFRPRFTRQRIVGRYILDFFCPKANLAIELDGSQHYEQEAIEYDNIRTEFLNSYGIEVVRFPNSDIDKNFDNICNIIADKVSERCLIGI